MSVNGWPVIERMLYRRKKNQSDLARLLGMSPAAITQIKKGDFLLSAESLEKILFYLGAGTEEENELFENLSDKGQIAEWAVGYVKKAMKEGLMLGMGNNEFAPRGNVTRAQTAVLIKRVIDYVASK